MTPIHRHKIVLYKLKRSQDHGPVPEYDSEEAIRSAEGKRISARLVQYDPKISAKIPQARLIKITFAIYRMRLVSLQQQQREFTRFQLLESRCEKVWKRRDILRGQRSSRGLSKSGCN